MELKKVYEIDPRTRKRIRELFVPKEIWENIIKERDENIKRAYGLTEEDIPEFRERSAKLNLENLDND